MSLLPFFEWCEATWIGEAIRGSLWLFPVIEAVHLLGLCVLGGAVLIIDLRLLGLGLRNHPVAQLTRDIRPWLIGSLVVMLSTGTALFLSESIKCYYNTSFWVKITTLPIALLFTFAIRNRIASREGLATTATSKLVGAISLTMWFVVAAAGRWIGFS
ncbi:MAG TPA: DUF6644 family protein [Vicinamibacterales bacterium]|nr:DUF6644 family protein [Vicinamibacterales bacterium]